MELQIQNRILTSDDLQYIRREIESHPEWHRTRISREICRKWNWVNAKGNLKDMACRTMLLKLEKKEMIKLPKPIRSSNNSNRQHKVINPILHNSQPVIGKLKEYQPLKIIRIDKGNEKKEWSYYLSAYHYLGYSGYVGENIKYLVKTSNGSVVACLLFGSSAWSCLDRDQWIGWSQKKRKKNLPFVIGNHRFLILPFVKVPHLASHILGLVLNRINYDYQEVYGHPVHLIETFVDKSRFKGTCYKAANFMEVGETRGRTRNDRHNNIQVPIKAIYVYPLSKQFRRMLNE